MHLKTNQILLKSLFFFCLSLPSCQKRNLNNLNEYDFKSVQTAEVKIPSPPSHAQLQEHSSYFRNIFYYYNTMSKNTSLPDTVNERLFLPNTNIINGIKNNSDLTKTVTMFHDILQKIKPSDLYKETSNANIVKYADVPEALRPTPKLTIVLINGVMGELNSTHPFQPIFTLNSQFKTQLASTLANRLTPQYDIAQNKMRPVPMNQTVQVASLDTAEMGQAIADIVYLKPAPFSFESMGTIRSNTEVFAKRLNDFFQTYRRTGNICFMGYSRGGLIALDMLSYTRSRPNEYPWAKDVKCVLGYSSPLYGSESADALCQPGTTFHNLYSTIKELGDGLRIYNAQTRSIIESTLNTCKASLKIAKTARNLQTNIRDVLANEPSGLRRERASTSKNSMQLSYAAVLTNAATGLKSFFGGPPYTIGPRAERFIEHVDDALKGLDQDNRTNWWSNNPLPDDVIYMSLPSTMGDITTASAPWSLVGNPNIYNTAGLDYFMARKLYYELYEVSHSQLNDGLVTVDKAIFLPNAMKYFNSNDNESAKNYKTHLLGILHGDHFRVAFPYVFDRENAQNKFPFEILLKSIATYMRLNVSR